MQVLDTNPSDFSAKLKRNVDTIIEEKDAWRVSVYEPYHYEKMKLKTTQNGSTIAVDDGGDIVSVSSAQKGDAKALLEWAVNNGGNKLDSYDGNFKYYLKRGFEPVSWCKWDEEFAPSGWVKGEHDEENIVFFIYKGEGKTTGYKDEADFYAKIKAKKDYDTAMDFRDKILKLQKGDK